MEAFPGSSVLDIGANIGDSAVMLGSSGADLILVEPDPYYSRLLEFNVSLLHGVRRIEKVVISQRPMRGELKRRGGTAKVQEGKDGLSIPTMTLEEACDPDTKLIKIDTDGYDFEILLGALNFLAVQKPMLYFEVECPSRNAYAEATSLVDQLASIGYRHYCVWDDSGLLILGDCDQDDVLQLAESLCHGTRGAGQRTTVWGLDVLAVVPEDLPTLRKVVADYRELQWTV